MICEPSPPADEDNLKGPKLPDHGGCGNLQPTIRKKGLQLEAKFKKGKDEDDNDMGEESVRIFARKAIQILNLLSDETLEMTA